MDFEEAVYFGFSVCVGLAIPATIVFYTGWAGIL